MDAYVSTEEEEDISMDDDINVHPATLKETPPEFLANSTRLVVSFMEQNGWFLFAGGLVLLYVWSKLNPIVTKWLEERAERKYQAMLHKDPDMFRSRQEAQEVARLRMQQELNIQAEIQEEKRKEREEKKREEWLARHQGSGSRAGYRLSDSNNTPPNSETKKPHSSSSGFRTEYNPLGGSSGSGGYRPARRSCPGGGCG